ncbi:hypothetical protein CYMTET_5076 [Cymbomonas tetramitiformis]|uniref:ribonuclease H n=1 Tax=Cymbomonas tetramitiformis TaxID=36881 RepID=A0AAE0LJF5_9CHLO|nr:hypothetical protein CYMTET_5076 [Cymbomonas tetramitiformis]
MGATHQQAKQCNWNLRVLIVANKAGWQAHCMDPDAAADCIRNALTTCPQSKVRTTTAVGQPRREANLHDRNEPNLEGRTLSVDCVVDTRPWQRYELPEVKTKDMTNAMGKMCNTGPHLRNDLCPQCYNVQAEVETWWESSHLHVEEGPAKWELLPGSRGGKWNIHPPTIQQVVEANTSHTRLTRQADAQTIWDKVARSKVVRYPTDFWPEHEPGVQGRRWELARDQTEDPRDLVPSDTPAQLTYPSPQRAHEATSYLYTDGSKREIETEEGGKEWASGAAVWDPRSGEGEAHMIRWEGEDQEVNRAELLAIQKAVTLPPPPSGKGLTICTDSANSIRQLESMRTKPHSMEHHRQRDLLYAILVNIETLVAAGHTVSLLKVKAHTGIAGNEKADEAAKQACTTGTLTEAWDNDETIKVKPMVPDGDSDSRELKGKLAVQKYVTTLLREQQAQGNNRLSAKMTELQGEPATWTHQLKTEHIFRWEAHHDQAQQTEEEQTIMRDPMPNQQQRADQTRDEENRQIRAMMEQQEEEEMLLMQEMQEQQEHWETEGRTDHTRGSDPKPAEAPPQPSEEEEIFEGLNELAEKLETPQGEQNDEEIFGMLNELIEQQEAPRGELANERQAHHDRVAEESRVHAMMEDPMPRTRWNQRKHDMTHSRIKNRNAPLVKEGKATENWLNKTMGHLKGDKPLHNIANGFWKRATYAARKTILKCRLRILPAQDYEAAKNSAGGSGKCTLEGCGHKGVDYAKGFLMRVGHALGGCNNPQMRGMFSDRADAHADELKHILDHHRKGGCKVLAYTGKKRDPGVKPRVLPNYILTRGQCRHDGKDNPGRNDGPDTIPSFVDIVMIEGLEDLEDGWECTQQEAPARVKNLHLIEAEVAYRLKTTKGQAKMLAELFLGETKLKVLQVGAPTPRLTRFNVVNGVLDRAFTVAVEGGSSQTVVFGHGRSSAVHWCVHICFVLKEAEFSPGHAVYVQAGFTVQEVDYILKELEKVKITPRTSEVGAGGNGLKQGEWMLVPGSGRQASCAAALNVGQGCATQKTRTKDEGKPVKQPVLEADAPRVVVQGKRQVNGAWHESKFQFCVSHACCTRVIPNYVQIAPKPTDIQVHPDVELTAELLRKSGALTFRE